MKYLKPIPAVIAASVLGAASANAQVIFDTVGGSYEQNFSSLNWNAGETLGNWTNNSTLLGWSISNQNSVATSQYRPAWAGSQTSNNLGGADAPNYTKVLQILTSGTHAGDDRIWDENNRFGFRTGATPGNSFATLQLTNGTGATLNQFTLGYQAAQFFARDGGAIDVRYSFDNSTWTTISGAGGIAGTDNMRYTAPVVSSGVNLALNTEQILASFSNFTSTVSGLNWAPDASIYIQFAFWRDLTGVASSSSPILTIDDVTFAAIPEPATYALIFGGIGLGLAVWVRRRKA
jgi:hypothetical protein